MLIRPEARGEFVRARVAVVGAGPAGLALALRLGEAGIDVALIESGRDGPDAAASALGAPAEAPPRALQEGVRRFGGASWTWGGRCVAYDAIDFEPRPGAEAPGWPIDRAELMRTADAAAKFIGIEASMFEAEPCAALAGARVATVLERWSAQPRIAEVHRRAVQESLCVRAYLGLTCVGAEIDQGGTVRALNACYRDGRRAHIEADAFVLAVGGVETARMLLWLYEAAGRAAPAWLGRGLMNHLYGRIADMVFTDDPLADFDYRRDGGCFVRRRLGFDAATLRAESLLNIAFHIDNPSFGDWRHGSAGLSLLALALGTPGLGEALAPRAIRDVLLGSAWAPDDALKHLTNVGRAPLSAARFAAAAVGGRLSRPVRPGVIERSRARRYSLRFCGEDLARLGSGIRLSREMDALDVPRAILAPRIVKEDVESVLRAHTLLDKEVRRVGFGRLEFVSPPEERAAAVVAQSGDMCHQIGLARMGDDPRSSVVDRDARVHDLANLYVAGGAVLPTSGQANPTFAILCQALRLGDHLAAKVLRAASISTAA